ncbi:helix-turn-helix domain-containing protein [Micrococcales bacterium 31B]|nr:helix-turn-helix domain-containing protein [Micrococcales bacterium 31B]
MTERFFTVADIAEMLKVAPATVRSLIKSGELEAFLVGKRGEFRVEASKFDAYIEAQHAKHRQSVAGHAAADTDTHIA